MPIHVSPSIRIPISHNSYTFPTQAARPAAGQATTNRHILSIVDYYSIISFFLQQYPYHHKQKIAQIHNESGLCLLDYNIKDISLMHPPYLCAPKVNQHLYGRSDHKLLLGGRLDDEGRAS